MAEPALSWRGLSIPPGPGGTGSPGPEPAGAVGVPDVDLDPGGVLLATHHLPQVLKTLAGWAAGLDLDHPGSITWEGRALGPRSTPGDRLERFRRTVLVDSRSRLLTGWTLLQNVCLDLEYNQGCHAASARVLAEARIRALGLERLLAPGEPAGPDRGLALIALAMARLPNLIVLDRPRSWLGDQGLAAALEAIRRFPALVSAGAPGGPDAPAVGPDGAEAGAAEAQEGGPEERRSAADGPGTAGSGAAPGAPGIGAPKVRFPKAPAGGAGEGPVWDGPSGDGADRPVRSARAGRRASKAAREPEDPGERRPPAPPAVLIVDHSRRAYPEELLDALLDLEPGGEAGR